MSKFDEFEDKHHVPRMQKKKKQASRVNEDGVEKRINRINFKNYVRQLKEDELLNMGLDEDEFLD